MSEEGEIQLKEDNFLYQEQVGNHGHRMLSLKEKTMPGMGVGKGE
jgi:hypothetical protein